MVGITSFGAYIPKLRLARKSILEANAWGNAALRAHGKGERSMCNWDEDSVTMAVAASRDALRGRKRDDLGGVFLASTTLPFLDRQNAGILAGALNLSADIGTLDITSSQKAGTSGLIAALDVVKGRGDGPLLFAASERRRARASSVQELRFGDGAVALVLGQDQVVAEFLGGHSRSVDFLDHFRGEGRDFDYNWEERWIRDEGYLKIVPPTIEAALKKTKLKAKDVKFLLMPCMFPAVPRGLAKQLGFAEESVRDNLGAVCGETGVAHPLLMLVAALQEAAPGDKFIVVGFGNGCDVLLFEATDALKKLSAPRGVKGALQNRREETNYNKFLTFNHLVEKEFGIRAEVDISSPLTALYRKRDMVLGMVGGKCSACGTPQFPKTEVCVNPECNKTGTQTELNFADRPAKVMSWSADYLTFTLDPPGHYGMVQFDEGGRFMADFTDFGVGEVEVGMPVEMVFRIKSFDERRGFRRYFWKAAPLSNQTAN